MFTGIVEAKGTVLGCRVQSGVMELQIDLHEAAEGVRVGDSVSVRGCCLTVEALNGSVARFHLMGQTLSATDFASTVAGGCMNLERALRLGDRLGGHLVSGHVDGVGTVLSVQVTPEQTTVRIEVPECVRRYCIPRGSLCVEGVSLTLAHIESAVMSVCLIPHTLAATTLGALRAGDRVHLEADQVGKWMEQLLPQRSPQAL